MKPFRPDAYVATFADAALRDALDEIRVLARTDDRTYCATQPDGVLAALRTTLAKVMGFEPGSLTLARMVPQLVLDEAARRWAKDYDRAIKTRLREVRKRRKATKRKTTKRRKHA